MQEEPFPSEKIFNLDSQAKELGMGGKLSPESDESTYKKRMQQRQKIQADRLKIRKTKKGLLIAVSYTHLTLPTILTCRSRWSPYH